MYRLKTSHKKLLADTFTPVSIYLKLRDKFSNNILLESSDYHGNENSYSYICCHPIASIKVENEIVTEVFPDAKTIVNPINSETSVPTVINNFINQFQTEKSNFKFITNGLFGYMSYDTVRYFEDVKISPNTNEDKQIPDIIYSIYQFVIVLNHFKNELFIFENSYDKVTHPEIIGMCNDKNNSEPPGPSINTIETIINNKNYPSYKFNFLNEEKSNFSDKEFLKIIAKGKQHCHRGDVFQIVLSREFSQQFKGDEFNVYRALRSINPSPYLFYFDFGNFKLFGSSPEAQIVIKNNTASIYPIAGTFRRTGDDKADAELAEQLKKDTKENAEHTMLVDLARNDLSRNCSDVKVETYKEIQFYSHLIHLVSKVSGQIGKNISAMKIVADTFPAGTLSGAPKYKAMQLIDKYENNSRGFYGGCIGFIGFNGDFNHAIIIRSFLSKNNTLYYRAGAGIVANSKEESELQEVNNKLLALKNAMELAKEI